MEKSEGKLYMKHQPKTPQSPYMCRYRQLPSAGTAATAQILSIIRNSDGIARTELATLTGLSKSTISRHVDILLSNGLIVESGEADSSGGRRGQLLWLRKSGGSVLSVDLGATSLDVAVCNLNAEPLLVHSEDANVADGPDAILKRVIIIAHRLLNQLEIGASDLKGIGMGIPGPVDFSAGRPVIPPIMPGWDGYPVRDFLQEEFACAAYVDNDVNIMTLGEQWAGLGKGVDNFIFVKVGTGIGSGIVCQGKLYRGSSGCAGDIGHIGLDHMDSVCTCGHKGCLESLAAGPVIARRAEQEAAEGRSKILADLLEERGFLTARDVGLAATRGDPVSMEIIRESGRLIGLVSAKLINFFNPSLVVIGGGVSNLGDVLLASIREAIYSRSLPLATRNLAIQCSSAGDIGGVIGAAVLVLNELFSAHQIIRSITT